MTMRAPSIRRGGLLAVLTLGMALIAQPVFAAVKIERVVSPGGIVAWLVREPAVPLVTVEFAFRGGASQDAVDKVGLSQMTAQMLDEGAGELDSRAFQQEMEKSAIELSFRTGQDNFHGTLRTLGAHRAKAFDLLKLALGAPRFDAPELERIRAQTLSGLERETQNPNAIARRRWWEAAFPNHPYGRNSGGTIETVAKITPDDLKGYAKRVFAREYLTVAVVGDIDAPAVGAMLDQVFGGLPAKATLVAVPEAKPQKLGQRIVADLDVPQAVINFGGLGIARKDPDFIPAYIVNHILAGGSFSSRLYTEVREKRGLAYGVSGSLLWYRSAAVFAGSTATRNDRTKETLEIIEAEIKRMADGGPDADEFAKAKSYLKGSYPLNLDTSSKIASQLVQIQLDDLGIDYIERRDQMIDAVTLDDARRVAKRLLDGGLLVTVVGRPAGLTAKGEGG
jgi:zinc protease